MASDVRAIYSSARRLRVEKTSSAVIVGAERVFKKQSSRFLSFIFPFLSFSFSYSLSLFRFRFHRTRTPPPPCASTGVHLRSFGLEFLPLPRRKDVAVDLGICVGRCCTCGISEARGRRMSISNCLLVFALLVGLVKGRYVNVGRVGSGGVKYWYRCLSR